ncbi:MAG: bifunctional diaminohydroxyphosphoribosylaminopyrimidine deaminase/5-amino-6-(5-phosphoribosylamino)uracil reductase RibD [Candidatus Obscuribacterales bacterium]|nr:bifunctional diaminohydroxyphosphoribosylaminopyrimidine deaminase/5-amino-6-(5-phosphoribosylamino)uracil reductase RibD [Candidatus Obscuribacterales bacterium]
MDDIDIVHMLSCLELASKATGRTSPNPMVGSVIVDATGKVVGSGFHEKAGTPHAEVHAIKEAGDAARGGTLYVNLEPCCHHGRTPPCSEAVIASGVKRVVIGMGDPNPKVAGGGIKQLNDAGIETRVGVLEDECQWLNRAFVKRIKTGLPWVCLKLATTLDGRIADRHGNSRWITGAEARAHVHQLRNEYDAVMVGAHTAIKDDPQLNVRDIRGSRDPVRVIVDSKLKLDPAMKVFQKTTGGKTIIFCSEESLRDNKIFSDVEIVAVKSNAAGLDLQLVLRGLLERDVQSVLCEGGSRLAGSLLESGLVDEVQWLIAPKIISDANSIPAVANVSEVLLTQAFNLRQMKISTLGSDILVQGLVEPRL